MTNILDQKKPSSSLISLALGSLVGLPSGCEVDPHLFFHLIFL